MDATDYDHRDADDGGCDPDGCVPENTRDRSRAANSRWSCEGDDCCITYSFEEPQDIVSMRIAFHLGNERTRTLDVYDNGDHHSEITSSGNTLGYETFYLNTDETEDLKLCLDGDDDEWLSITEVGRGLHFDIVNACNVESSFDQCYEREGGPFWGPLFSLARVHSRE